MKRLFNTFSTYILFLLEPEDSVTGFPGRHETRLQKKGFWGGAIKAIFWMVISIAVGLAISSL